MGQHLYQHPQPQRSAAQHSTAQHSTAQHQRMRATAVHRETVDVHDGTQAHAARTAARLTRSLLEQRSALAVGDWVLCARDAHQPWHWWAAVAC